MQNFGQYDPEWVETNKGRLIMTAVRGRDCSNAIGAEHY